jgi:hypothetical protein
MAVFFAFFEHAYTGERRRSRAAWHRVLAMGNSRSCKGRWSESREMRDRTLSRHSHSLRYKASTRSHRKSMSARCPEEIRAYKAKYFSARALINAPCCSPRDQKRGIVRRWRRSWNGVVNSWFGYFTGMLMSFPSFDLVSSSSSSAFICVICGQMLADCILERRDRQRRAVNEEGARGGGQPLWRRGPATLEEGAWRRGPAT